MPETVLVDEAFSPASAPLPAIVKPRVGSGSRGIHLVERLEQVPLADGPHTPSEVRALIAEGRLTSAEVIEAIVTSTANALQDDTAIVIAHLFSVLPKLGLDEGEVPLILIERLAAASAQNDAQIEISERWACPSARTLRPFLRRSVPVLLSTDSHSRETIGRYSYCMELIAELSRCRSRRI